MVEPHSPARIDVVVAANPGLLTLDGSRTYILGRGSVVVIDPGPALAEHMDAITAAVEGRDSVVIALTHGHPDHAGAARPLADRLSAAIAASPATAEMAGLDPPDLPLQPASELTFDGGRLATVPAPGHSPDHVCFHWPEGRALFAGDVMLGEGTSMVAPPEGDMSAYLQTLQRLAQLELDVIYPGHGPLITDPRARIESYIRHRLERESQVLDAIASGARTLPEIRSHVYPDLAPALQRAAEGSVAAHLEKLARDGRIAIDADGRASRV